MMVFGGVIVLEILAGILVAAIVFQFTAWYRHRRLDNDKQNSKVGFEPTNEINIDPTTGQKQRVWYNSSTGERRYETFDE